MDDTALNRRITVRELLKDRLDMLVVSGLGSPSYDVFNAGDHDANFYLWGAMGSAALVGLGLALAQSEKPVVVITGDGEQLMGLGGLATIAVKRPGNLSIIVLDNGHFGETGMQLSHTGYGVDLHRIAESVGFPCAVDLHSLDEVRAFKTELLDVDNGPRYATVRVVADLPERVLPPRDGVFLKTRFRRYLGLPTI